MAAGNQDWRRYDAIADRYDHVWRGRFEPLGRALWELLRPDADAFALDIGTGTGALPLTLRERHAHQRRIVGCDRSVPMLRRAAGRVHLLHVAAADAMALPFSADTFDVVTASFVLSHVRDYRIALAEARRVLKPSGRLGVSNWTPPTDQYNTVWSDLLMEAISKEAIERAASEVTPHEALFSQSGRLEAGLIEARFVAVRGDVAGLELSATVEEYLEDRALSARGRLALDLLGPERWARFNEDLDDVFRARFGPRFTYTRQAFVAVGQKASERARTHGRAECR